MGPAGPGGVLEVFCGFLVVSWCGNGGERGRSGVLKVLTLVISASLSGISQMCFGASCFFFSLLQSFQDGVVLLSVAFC